MSSSDIPRSSDGTPNWAADTDPVGPVTPELALVDPELTGGGEINNEVTMSSMQFGDGPLGAPEPAPATLDGQQIPVNPPFAPLNTVAPVAEAVVAPVPAELAPPMPVADMRDVPLGTLVFRAGLLPEEQLEEALQEGMKTGKRLGEILLERGWVSENDLGRLLAGQKGLPFVELDPAAIDPVAPSLLPGEKARLHGALPIGFQGGVPVVAVADPSNDLVVENVRRALACEPVLVVAGRDALMQAINQVYGFAAEAPMAPPAPAAVVEPQPVPVVEPVVASTPLAEPVAQVVEPVPVVEPVVPALPVLPVAPEPVAVEPVAPEPFTPEPFVPEPAASVVPPSMVEPVAAQPGQNGGGVWLGQSHEVAAEPVAPPPVMAPPQVEQPVEPEVPAWPPATEPAAEVIVPQPEPVVTETFVPEPAVEPVVEPMAPEVPLEPMRGSAVEHSWAVVVRLADGDRIELGSYATESDAVDGARSTVAEIATEGSWPFVAGRFIRPDAIVSIDLVELEGGRWLGSAARAAALGAEHQPVA